MERLDARVQAVWFVGAMVAAVGLGVVVAAAEFYVLRVGRWVGPAVVAVVLAVGAVHTVFRYRVWRYDVRGDHLFIRRGVLTRVVTVVPFVRVQHVDTQRDPVDRLVGLSSVVVYTAGSRGADVTIPGLPPEQADELQDRLRRLAIESEHEDAV